MKGAKTKTTYYIIPVYEILERAKPKQVSGCRGKGWGCKGEQGNFYKDEDMPYHDMVVITQPYTFI